MASVDSGRPLPDCSDTRIADLVEDLARATSNHDQTRLAAQGLQRLLHARVSVSAGGTFRVEHRGLVDSAVLVPRWHHPPAGSSAEAAGPVEWASSARSLLISPGARHRTPRYLVWRADPFTLREVQVADGIALMLIALHLRWEATEGAQRRVPDRPALPSTEAGGPGLTTRETVMLEHLAEGLSAAAIGSLTGISARTVRKHLQHVYAKLGAHDRLVAVQTARAAGLLPTGIAPVPG